MNISQTDSTLHLPINLGTEVLLEIVELGLRVRSELTGMKQGHFLMVGLSLQDLPVGLRSDSLKESQIIVRYLFRGSVYGFKTRLLNAVTSPERLLILTYPVKIEEYRVRNNPRYECILPASTHIEGAQAVDSVIVDISREGLRCVIKTDGLAEREQVYQAIDTDKEARLLVRFPCTADPVEFPARIRNINKDSERIIFGAVFGPLGDEARARLEGFISLVSGIKK